MLAVVGQQGVEVGEPLPERLEGRFLPGGKLPQPLEGQVAVQRVGGHDLAAEEEGEGGHQQRRLPRRRRLPQEAGQVGVISGRASATAAAAWCASAMRPCGSARPR